MTETLEKRGPDEEGVFLESNVNFGHKRLSIVDIENGKQPMSCKINDTTYTIVYNGQLYNTDEIRKTLLDSGFEFRGHSDTEVLLKAYIYYKKDVLKYLNGIFAFAVWNETENVEATKIGIGACGR